MIISIYAEKSCEKFQYSFMIKKTLRKKGIEGNSLNLIKKPSVNVLNGERLTNRPMSAV